MVLVVWMLGPMYMCVLWLYCIHILAFVGTPLHSMILVR